MSDHRSLPARPDLRHLRDEAKARRGAGEFPSLSLAHLAIAREHGFVSWPRLKHHVEALSLDAGARAQALVRSACSSDVRRAQTLLALDPALARHDLACACVAGEPGEVAGLVGADPARATVPMGPLKRPPILYACFSRLLRDPARAAGIRAAVRVLIDAGADPDARFMQGDWVQSTLYGAAGIANDAALTAMLIEAGADPNDDGGGHHVGEALYHACEFRDPECARLLIEAQTRPSVVHYCLGRALNFPNLEMVRMLCDHGARPDGGNLAQAVWRRRGAETVGVLLAAGAPADGDGDGPSPLRIAVRWGDEDVAALLAARGADASVVTGEDRALGEYLRDPAAAPPAAAAATLGELLDSAVERGDRKAVGRLLHAGASPDGDPSEEHPPLANAAWRGYAGVVAELLAAGARTAFTGGGSAIGAALHGSRHCQHPEGGPTMATLAEIDRDRYAATVRVLLDAGATVPASFGEDGGPSAATLLAELGM
jgi:ankyrin repeat protein